MPLGTDSMFGVILPVEKTNLILNSSFERGTVGVAAIQAATVGSSSQYQTFGAWSCQVTPGANGTSGAAFGTWTAGAGTFYSVSAYVRGAGDNYILAVGDSNGLNLSGSTAFTNTGTWQRYTYLLNEAAGAVRRVVIRKTSGGVTPFYVDGVQVEVSDSTGALTTYIDGDQEGCQWSADPHVSQSFRSGQTRAGGSVVALADLGFRVDDATGIGMAPLETATQSYALLPGAEFQSQRAELRSFVLSTQMGGTTWRDFHNTRRTVIRALQIDTVAEQQPTRFWYVGGEGTVQIDAVMDAGMEGGNKSGFTESYGVRFLAHDPYFRSVTEKGTSLATWQNIGSVNYIAYRDPLGRWGTLGVNGTTVNNSIYALAIGTDKTLFLGGQFSTVGGTAYPNIAKYSAVTNRFGTLVGGTINDDVYALSIGPTGSLYIGGTFTFIGTVGTFIGFHGGASFGTLKSLGAGVGVGVGVKTMDWNQTGTLFVGGDFKLANGTTAPNIAFNYAGAWGTLAGQPAGTVNGRVNALVTGLDGQIYFGGNFGSAGGTAVNLLAKWNGAFGSMSNGVDNIVSGMAVAPNGKIVTVGQFTYTGGSALVNGAALWNGVSYEPMGAGLTTAVNVSDVLPLNDGRVLAVGGFTKSGSLTFPDTQAIWNGYSWLPVDVNVNFQLAAVINTAVQTNDGTLYVAGDFVGTAQAAVVTQHVNPGNAVVYPTIKILNQNATIGTLYQIANTLTGDAIYFNNLAIQPNEELTLVLQPGKRSFQSSFRGNVFGKILPGSNLASFRLLPGTNYISAFANGTLTASIYYRPAFWSADGTVDA